MKKHLLRLTLISLATALAACGSTQKSKDAQMQKDIQKQSAVSSPQEMLARAAQSFANIEGLTPEKKTKLGEIYTRTYTESMKIREELGKSKSLLFQTLAKSDYKSAEVNNLKKNIVSLDQKRLNLMFKALDEVQTVVGKGADAALIYQRLESYEVPERFMYDKGL